MIKRYKILLIIFAILLLPRINEPYYEYDDIDYSYKWYSDGIECDMDWISIETQFLDFTIFTTEDWECRVDIDVYFDIWLIPWDVFFYFKSEEKIAHQPFPYFRIIARHTNYTHFTTSELYTSLGYGGSVVCQAMECDEDVTIQWIGDGYGMKLYWLCGLDEEFGDWGWHKTCNKELFWIE